MERLSNPELTYIGKTTFRREGRLFGIRQADRFSHTYLIGRTGTGKSTLLGTMALQDLGAVRGLALLEPHDDLVEDLLGRVPPDRQADVLYLDAPDATATWTYNPLGGVSRERRALAVAGLVEVFRRLWHDDWVPWSYRIAPATLTSVAEPTSPVFTSLGLAFGMAVGELALAVGGEGDVELALRQAEIAAKAILLSAPSRASGVF